MSETFVIFLSSFKQLDTVEFIKVARQPITNQDFSNGATLSQSEVLEYIMDPFYPPFRILG